MRSSAANAATVSKIERLASGYQISLKYVLLRLKTFRSSALLTALTPLDN